MKKFLYLLITIVIVNFFLPFSLTLTKELEQKNIAEAVENCDIISAKWNPEGEQEDNFYNDGTTGGDKTGGNIIIKTKNCVGNPGINLTIYESDGLTSLTDDSWNDSDLHKRKISVPTDNFTVKMELGEEDCENLVGGGIGYDCDLYFAIREGDVVIYESFSNPGGLLYYDCDALCQANAKLLAIIPNGNDNAPVNIDLQDPTDTKNEYQLLAPIGEFKVAPDNIGEYFNTIFLIAIGLCGALAVIMIVIGGIQYMGDESIFGKTEAKSRIKMAILGLIIALAAYALLNTINPDLLGVGGLNIKQVTAEIEEAPMPRESTNIPRNKPVSDCKTEIIELPMATGGKMNMCTNIAYNVQAMIKLANESTPQIKLSGSAFRSYEDQLQLRKDNKCPDIYNSPPSDCKPPTAKPGTSRHESGQAIDFRCDGVTINSRTNKCFIWLQKYASGFGLKNFEKEPWHWSTDGR